MNYRGRKFTKIKQTQLNFKYLIRKNLFVLLLFYDFKQKQYNTSVILLYCFFVEFGSISALQYEIIVTVVNHILVDTDVSESYLWRIMIEDFL